MSAILAEVHVEEGVARLEPRVARIESDVESLKKAVDKLDAKVDRVDAKVDRLDAKFDEKFEKVDQKFEKLDGKINGKFETLDGKINGLDKRMVVMETEFGGLKENQARFGVDLRDLRSSLDTKFLWILTTMIAFGTALLAAMAKGFHWLG